MKSTALMIMIHWTRSSGGNWNIPIFICGKMAQYLTVISQGVPFMYDIVELKKKNLTVNYHEFFVVERMLKIILDLQTQSIELTIMNESTNRQTKGHSRNIWKQTRICLWESLSATFNSVIRARNEWKSNSKEHAQHSMTFTSKSRRLRRYIPYTGIYYTKWNVSLFICSPACEKWCW